MILRVGDAEDIEPAVEIFTRASAARRVRRPVPEAAIDEAREMLQAEDSWFYVVHDDENAVGMAAAMPSRANQGSGDVVPGVCHLGLLFVVPERWGEGIGALLLDTVVADARGCGFSRIDLVTHDDNERAHRLYMSRGFERTGWSSQTKDPANGTVSEWARAL